MTDTSSETTGEAPAIWFQPFRFRLVHLIYIVTLLAVSMGTFGPAGLVPGVPIAVFWAIVFTARSRPLAFFVTGILMLLLAACLPPSFSAAREAARRMQCSNNVKQIGLALHNYHDVYGSFPPAFVPDENGKPKHSWRVLLLPFLQHQRLYDAYKFAEPWDSPSNRALISAMPAIYECPSRQERTTCTSYVAVVGSHTAWPGPVATKLSDLKDGSSQTVLIVEAGHEDIPWTEPRDLSLAEALDQLTSTDPEQVGGHRADDFFHQRFVGRWVVKGDGSVNFVANGVSRTTWTRCLTIDDGVELFDCDWENSRSVSRTLKVGNCIRLGVWIAVVLFPLPWVWLTPTSSCSSRSSRLPLPGTRADGMDGIT